MARPHTRSVDALRCAHSTRRVATLSAAALVLTLSECGSGDDSSDPADEAATTTDTDATETGGAGAATLTIVTDTGESWTLQQDTCSYTPDAEGDIIES